jgi:hypothetical protein
MKYRLELGEISKDYRATSVEEFRNDVILAPEADGYRYFVDGKQVSRDAALAATSAARQARWDKKCQTHKRVRISVGCTTLSNTYRETWVRR